VLLLVELCFVIAVSRRGEEAEQTCRGKERRDHRSQERNRSSGVGDAQKRNKKRSPGRTRSGIGVVEGLQSDSSFLCELCELSFMFCLYCGIMFWLLLHFYL